MARDKRVRTTKADAKAYKDIEDEMRRRGFKVNEPTPAKKLENWVKDVRADRKGRSAKG